MTLEKYVVNVFNRTEGLQEALLEPANETDMPSSWSCNWPTFWRQADFDCEAIIKLSHQDKNLGLIRFALYPFAPREKALALESLAILNLETHPYRERPVYPVGAWLIWYASQIAVQFCIGEADGTLIQLVSLETAIAYYRDKVMMEELGWVTIAPREDGYAFRFTKNGAAEFLQRQESSFGRPRKIS
jgi:hypothetical protein